jgi:hypothetical protein
VQFLGDTQPLVVEVVEVVDLVIRRVLLQEIQYMVEVVEQGIITLLELA